VGKRNSLELIDIKIKIDSVPVVNAALKLRMGPELAPIKNFLSHVMITDDGFLSFKANKNENDDRYFSFEDGSTPAFFGIWDEHEKIASWVKLHSEKGGKMVLFSLNGDGAAQGWEFNGKGKMRELQYRYLGKWE
jgi:hypothetical protein